MLTKNIIHLVLITILIIPFSLNAQNKKLNLNNVLVIAQQENLSDKYSLEVALLELFNSYKIKTKASLNILKEGGQADVLLSDSLQDLLKEKGIDTYLLVSVRGYDSKFTPSTKLNSLKDELEAGHLFPLYRENATRISFTFTFYRGLEPVYQELIRTGTVSDKESVIRKLLKKVEKRLVKEWL